MKRIKEKYDAVRTEMYYYHTDWDWWYDGDYDDRDWYYDRYYFEYTKEKTSSSELLTYYLDNKVYYTRRRLQENYTPYHIIDMESIFTVEEIRERKINTLLGVKDYYIKVPLFADIIKNKRLE